MVSLKDVPFAKATLPNPGPTTGKGGAATVITNMAFVGGKLIVAGLSNEEFASARLRAVAYPFKAATDPGTAVEILPRRAQPARNERPGADLRAVQD